MNEVMDFEETESLNEDIFDVERCCFRPEAQISISCRNQSGTLWNDVRV